MASKMQEGIKQALQLIEEGKYAVEDGKLYNANGKCLGSVDKNSGNMFVVIRGIDILLQRLMYAHYHGFDSLKEGEGIYFLDEDRTNLRKENLVQLPRKGATTKLLELRTGLSCPLQAPPTPLTKAEPTAEDNAVATAEEQAIQDIKEGTLNCKEIALKNNVAYKKVLRLKNKINELVQA